MSFSFEGKLKKDVAEIEEKARTVVFKGGIHDADVHQRLVMGATGFSKHFDILVTIFCLESANSSLEQYKCSMRNTVRFSIFPRPN